MDFLPWVSSNHLIFLLVKIFGTEMFCFEKLAVFLLLGLMLLCHPNTKHQYFCSPQDAFPTFRTSKCHLWVRWLGCIRRKPTPHLVIPCRRTDATSDLCLLSEIVSIAGCISQLIYLATLCQPYQYSLCSLPSFQHILGTKICSAYHFCE